MKAHDVLAFYHDSALFVLTEKTNALIALILYNARFTSKNYRDLEIMPNVKVRDNEPFEIALRRFKRTCEKAGVVAEVRSREFYEKPTSIRKREKAAAVKRNLKNLKREINRRVRMY